MKAAYANALGIIKIKTAPCCAPIQRREILDQGSPDKNESLRHPTRKVESKHATENSLPKQKRKRKKKIKNPSRGLGKGEEDGGRKGTLA